MDWGSLGITDAINFQQDFYDFCIDKYLATAMTLPIVHWTEMIGIGLLTGGKKVGNNILDGAGDLVSKAFISTISQEGVGIMNTLAQSLADPNIEGIPVSAESLSGSRDVDVSDSLNIVQSACQKEHRTDNAAPHLKEWTLSGYLTPLSTADSVFLIKPSLLNQVKYLDTIAKSRRPVWFKDNNCVFHKVNITHFSEEWKPDATNAVRVSIGLREYNPLVMTSSLTSVITAREV